jgi:aminoglycoside phosphotransferase family enzyme
LNFPTICAGSIRPTNSPTLHSNAAGSAGRRSKDVLLRRYRERTRDAPPRELVRFYKALNALVRARIAIRHLSEPGARTPDQWVARAAAYLAIAAREGRMLSR